MKGHNPHALTGLFGVDSIGKLNEIFAGLGWRDINYAESIRLKQAFLSIVDEERRRHRIPKYVSPDGMNFVYFSFDACEYNLLTPYGVICLVKDNRLFDGELSMENVRWIEDDHLLLFDMVYLCGSSVQKYICHYSGDDNAFVHELRVEKSPAAHGLHAGPSFASHFAGAEEHPMSMDAPFPDFPKEFGVHPPVHPTIHHPDIDDAFPGFFEEFGVHPPVQPTVHHPDIDDAFQDFFEEFGVHPPVQPTVHHPDIDDAFPDFSEEFGVHPPKPEKPGGGHPSEPAGSFEDFFGEDNPFI